VLTDVLSFAVVAGLVTIIPGLDTAIVLRSAITQGRRPAFATALGVGAGCLAWGVAAAVGVSALLSASEVAYTVLRIAGAVYMVWLGVRLLRDAVRDHGTGAAAINAPAPPAGGWSCWRRGQLTNLLNPKIGAFYIAVLPQFIPAHASHLAVGLLLACVHDLEGLVWFTAIIVGAGSARRWLARRTAQRVVDGTTGAVLVGFGLRLGLSRR
jgi:threonine/homoserine/homoserine lactone efflux protein